MDAREPIIDDGGHTDPVTDAIVRGFRGSLRAMTRFYYRSTRRPSWEHFISARHIAGEMRAQALGFHRADRLPLTPTSRRVMALTLTSAPNAPGVASV